MPSIDEDFFTNNIMPHECRLRDITYSAPITVDIEYTRGRNIVKKNGVKIGQMPIMLGSSNCWLTDKTHQELANIGECPYDPRGYFVIRGVEKVVLIQEQMSKNRIIVEVDPKRNIFAHVTSSTHETKSRTAIICHNEKFAMKHNIFTEDIPVCIIFKAMGIESDQEIAQLIGTNPKFLEEMSLSLIESSRQQVLTQEQALNYIGVRVKSKINRSGPNATVKSRRDEAFDILKEVVLAHVEVKNNSLLQKCRFIALMVRRIIETKEDPSKIDDKDYYGNKRLELAGQLISLLFEDTFKRFQSDLQKQINLNLPRHKNKKEAFDVHTCFRTDTITMSLENAISTGNWSLKRFKMERAGVTQVLSRLSFIAALGMMTRINSQFEKTRKISGPRSLQPSQWGMLCPSDTPEGESCGLVKNLALTTHVTTDQPVEALVNLCINLGMEDASLLVGTELYDPNTFLIFINGIPMGVHRNPQKFLENFRLLRRKGKINEFVSIYFQQSKPDSKLQSALHIACDGGRLVRPLIIVENGRPLIKQEHIDEISMGIRTFNDCIKEGRIEYIDVNEENNTLIALSENDLSPNTTHMEIDPLTILGCVAGLIPYPHHNQSPRNTYQCAMGKQAIGSIGYNQMNRVDTVLLLLVYNQRPLVKTKTIEMINYEKLPAGQNASVAIMSYSGYDIEDAVVLNRASIDRGFGRVIYIRRHEANIKKYADRSSDLISMPPEQVREGGIRKEDLPFPLQRFHALDKDGIAKIGSKLGKGDIWLNKYTPVESETNLFLNKNREIDYNPSPESYKGTAPSYVDRIQLSSNPEKQFQIKLIARQTRRPEIGDKFSSRHGQKGVVGIIVPQEDMPFAENGWCPDLIMNPHGFPSRMTVGKLMELMSGKAGVLEGDFKYGTAFAGDKVEEMGKILVKHGYSYFGKDYLTSGLTGEPLQCYVFCGPVYYQRLKHMVQDKMHARPRGPMTSLTRQPTEGRSRGGGQRLGEMERDCLIGYGAASLLNERLMISSDMCDVFVCDKCGFFGYKSYCNYCKDKTQVYNVKMPYACKLLLQELTCMNIRPKLKLKDA